MSRNRELSQFPEFLTVNDTYGSVGIGTSLTVSGIGTFENDLYVAGTLYAPSLNIESGTTLGDDLSTRNISASGIVTVTGTTDLNGDLDVDGHTELDNVRISGVTTFQQDIYLGNGDKINLGGPDDLQIYHDGSDSYIVDSGTGDLYIRGTAAIRFQNAAGTEDYAVFNDTGATELYYDDSKKLETTNTGVNVTGNIVASGNVTVGGTLIYEDVTNVDSVGIATARSGLRITGGGLDVVGVATFNNGVDTLDVIGHAEVDQLRVSGVSTFVGIVTSQSDVFVGNNLSVAGDARVVGVLTVGSSSITLDGSTNTINVGSGVTVHTTTVAVNQLEVAGLSTFAGIGTFQSDLFVGGTLYTPALIVNGSSVGDDITTRNISASGIITASGNIDANGDLDVDGHTELDNVNVSGVSTFVGIVTSQSDVFVGNDLSVAGDARIVGVLTVGSSSVTLNGDTNTITVGHGVTIHTTTASVNQLEVAGLSTFVGVATFQNDVYVPTLNVTTSLNVEGGSSLGEDIETRNLNAAGIITAVSYQGDGSALTGIDATSLKDPGGNIKVQAQASGIVVTGISTFSGNIDANGNLDVDGHTELDNVNIAGVLTATSAEFSGNVTVLGDLTYENVVNVDSIGIATARSGLRVTGGGLDLVGVSTFSGNVDLNADLDVDGHTELDNVNVSGVLTATSFVGDGSQITGVSGFATALSNDQTSAMNRIFIQPKTLYIPPNTQADVEATVYEGNVAFIREKNIVVGSGATLHIGSGTTMRVNILGLF